MIESNVTRAMRECTDPAILAATPDEQYMYHLLSFTKDVSTVSAARFLKLSNRLRRQHAIAEYEEFVEWRQS